jgi:mono/diheme cytochrome c family protein/uncharacterized protein (UPF0335 family)
MLYSPTECLSNGLPMNRRAVLLCLMVLQFIVPREERAAAEDVDFDAQIAPIFSAHCLECHGGAEPKGGLGLATREAFQSGGESGQLVDAKDATASLLWKRVSLDEMPPKHPLTEKQKESLRLWLVQGAKWGASPIDPFARTTEARAGRDWWALQPLRSPTLPQTVGPLVDAAANSGSANPIDQFVQAQLNKAELSPAAKADSRALIRRLYFDLLGLPPSPEKVAKFVANPTDAEFEKLTNELLASKHYGERWARHWLDVVRFGESDGFERNTPRENAWPYRDWVVNSLNNDMPYDEFARMQLIGDLLEGGQSGAAATGFWVAGVHNTVVGGSRRMKLLARQDELEEVLATVGQTFVGLTVNCARCHDHKFDPITQKEFYQMASAISGLGYGEKIERAAEETKKMAALDMRIGDLRSQLSGIDSKARTEIIAARKQGKAELADPPEPFAQWEFDGDMQDSIGILHGRPVGDARVENGALVIDGNSFVETAVLEKEIRAKTLEAWIQLDDLAQGGGGAITIETRNGVTFDSIVFAERESKQWMAGSNGFARTESFQGTQENEAVERPVHFAIVYAEDGTITGYRDGKPYGQPIRKSGLQVYPAGDTELIFGMRHKPKDPNRILKAKIHQAKLYDRALTAEEVAASSGNAAEYVPEKQLVDWLDEKQRAARQQLQAKLADLGKERDQQNSTANQKFFTLQPGGGATTNVLLRGDPDQLGAVVSAGAVGSVQGVDADFSLAPEAPEAERRRKLADWITDRENPLFTRVIVNRVWHYHFGQGIVDTPNDFGFNGGRPSHPELLEWLSTWFRDHDYRIKDLHRLILSSNTWKQAGYTRSGAEQDAENRLLWRMKPRRLEAESVRDAMLVVAGKLNAQMGGPSFKDVSVVSNNGTVYYEPIDVFEDAFLRRTIYRFNPRGGRSALLDTFDCPDPAATAPRRSQTTTPLQALSLLNNSFVLHMSDAFAERIRRAAGDDLSSQVTTAWQLAINRAPTDPERQLSERLVSQHGLAALCRGLFNANEFVVVE